MQNPAPSAFSVHGWSRWLKQLRAKGAGCQAESILVRGGRGDQGWVNKGLRGEARLGSNYRRWWQSKKRGGALETEWHNKITGFPSWPGSHKHSYLTLTITLRHWYPFFQEEDWGSAKSNLLKGSKLMISRAGLQTQVWVHRSLSFRCLYLWDSV